MARAGFNRDKFKELIVYLWELGEGDERLGATKLNKLLWYADKAAYLRSGRTITGARYIHLPDGPAPAAMVPVRDELVAEGRLRPDPRPVVDHVRKRMETVGPARLDAFDPDDLQDIRSVVREYWYLDNGDMSRLSHFEGGWVITKPDVEGEPPKDIPETAFWLSAAPLDEEQVSQGQALWQRLHG
jgi:antitoxin SocA-like protein